MPEPSTDEGRFAFGDNWRGFIATVNEERIFQARRALANMLGTESLDGKSFLDVGSGSGLSSLAARRMGAAKVHSFDYDPASVACTREMRRRYHPDDPSWTVERGDALDPEFLRTLGTFDVVYSWGVLHHTGRMWQALENVVPLVAPGGTLFVALYNDQGGASRRWTTVKRVYNRLPRPLRPVLALGVGVMFEGRSALIRLARLKNPLPFADWKAKKQDRGMSVWHDIVDWTGGYPFEVAKPEAVFDFFHDRGFALSRLKTCGGSVGCNEFVFTRMPGG